MASVDDDSKSNDSGVARESQVPKKLMRDAIKTGGEGLKGVRSRIKTMAVKKRSLVDRGKGIDANVPKKPRYEDLSQEVSDLLRTSQGSFLQCEVPIPRSILEASTKVTPSLASVETHDVPDSTESIPEEVEVRDGGLKPDASPIVQSTQDDVIASPQLRSAMDEGINEVPYGTAEQDTAPRISSEAIERGTTTETPSGATEQDSRATPETVLPSNLNREHGAGPSSQSPITSPKSGKKLPIRSLKDGLLGCLLQALQALVLEGYLQGGIGRTTLDRFADILVHHQIAISFFCFTLPICFLLVF